MPFDFHNLERLQKQVSKLKEQRYSKRLVIPQFLGMEGAGYPDIVPPAPFAGAFTLAPGQTWGGYDHFVWLNARVDIPSDFTGQIVGLFDFGVTGGGGNSGFESLLYLNGAPYQGVDTNHPEVFFPDAKPGETLTLQFRLWSGLVGGGIPYDNLHVFRQAELAILDEGADNLYFYMKNLLETHEILDDNSPHKPWLLNVAVEAWNRVDDRVPGSDAFYGSVAAALAFLDGELPRDRVSDISVNLVGHTHIDVAWLWRLCHTREKAIRSFSTVMRLMERDPNYIFLQTQAQLYAYIKEDCPALYEAIRQRVAEGRWEAAGGMWVECDCNLPSGESIARQVLYGTRFFENEFGSHSSYLWLPDVFGYSWALPQILKQAEIDTFITTKISWNDQNKLPYDTFRWRGIDGTEVLTHFVTTPENRKTRYYTYNGMTTPMAVKGVWENYSSKDLNTDLLIAYGYGDGGGGVNRDMLENIRHIDRIPGMPTVKTEQVTAYVERLHKTVAENPRRGYVPLWDGELYLEFHRGTYTSQAYNKNMNRRMEFLLRDAELLAVYAQVAGRDIGDTKAKLAEAWRIVLTHQFHDIIPGSSIHEVYADSHTNYEEARSLVEATLPAGTGTAGAEGFSVLNTANWSRSSVVRLAGSFMGKSFVAEDGSALSAWADSTGANILVPLEPLKARRITLRDGAPNPGETATITDTGLETATYRIAWDESGRLTRILDKRCGRDVLARGEVGNALTLYEDKPREYDAWELEYTHKNKPYPVTDLVKVETLQNSAVCAAVQFTWQYGDSTFAQILKVYPHTARIDFETVVDWQEREMVLKTSFGVDVRATSARYDIQYGSMERPITANTSWEAAKYEVVGHKWADLSESGYGVALLNSCKYGYDIHEGSLGLTLLKGSNYPDYSADRGEQRFTYSLLPHSGTWFDADVDGESWEINEPPILLGDGAPAALLNWDSRTVTLDALKPAEDENAVILRFHEKTGAHTKTALDVLFPFASWCPCNILERAEGEQSSDSHIEVDLHPFELMTIKIKL